MLKVAQINYIKHLRDEDGLSINEIARQTGLQWRFRVIGREIHHACTARPYEGACAAPASCPGCRKKSNFSPLMLLLGTREIRNAWELKESVLRAKEDCPILG